MPRADQVPATTQGLTDRAGYPCGVEEESGHAEPQVNQECSVTK